MNKSYRTVWNASLGAWVATSELTKARGKSSKSSRSAALAVVAATLAVAAYASTASAQSVGGGTATGAGTAVSANATDCNAHQAVFDPAVPRPIPGASAGDTSIAIGCAADAQGGLAAAIGFGAHANSAAGGSSIAIGANAMATSPDASNQIAIGRDSKAEGGAMALGSGTISSAPSSVAIGNQFGPGGATTKIDSQSVASIAIGTGSLVENSPFALAIGSQALLVNAQNSVAIGDSARSEAARSVVVGASANSAFVDSVVIGFHAATLTPNSVAIGSNSWAEAAVPTAQGTINGVTYNYAGTDPQGSVAVGSTTNNQLTSEFTRQLQAVAAGRVDANSTDGINGSQLFANQQAVEALADRAVQYDDGTKTTVTLNPGGASTTVTNVAPGALNAGSTDAVNGSQLFQTNNNVTNLGTMVTNLGTTVTNLDGRVTNIDTAGTKYFRANSTLAGAQAIGTDSVAIGPNAVANGNGNVALGAGSVATGSTLGNTAYLVGGTATAEVNVGGRRITGLSAGASDTDAVNVSQLRAVTAGASADSVQYDDASHTTVTLNPGGASTTVTNVAPGALNAGSTDAVNGSQLFQTNNNVTNLGTTVTNLGTTVTNLDGRVTNIDIAGTKYFRANSTLAGAQAIGTDSVAIGPNAVANGNGNVALGAGSVATGSTLGNTAYLVGGTATAEVNVGGRRITGLSAGASDTDAVNVSQLRAVTAGATANAVQYDDASHTTVTLNPGGASTTVTNVAPGALNAGSTDAVNGSQLFQTNNNVTNLGTTVTNLGTTVTNLDGRVTNIDIAGTKYFRANSTLAGAQAIGTDSVAIGPNAVANDANSVAIGLNASAQGPRNVALGSDSTADGSTLGNQAYLVGGTATGEVNVGDRRVSGVAAGSSDDDAVNVTQLRRLRDESIRYEINPDGSINFNSISLGGTGGGTVIHNVGPGVAGTDAVNVNQLNAATSVASSKWITANPTTYSAPVASGADSTAVGSGATSTGSNSVALGTGSNDGSRNNVVSVGSAGFERQVTNVAAGTQNTDAVNVSQLRSVTDALGGGSTIDSSTGNVIAPTYNITRVDASGGTSTATYNNVGDALGGLSTSVIYLNDAVTNMSNGGGIKYFHANSGQADSSATGAESTAMGPQASASGDGAIAAGDRSNASGSGSVAIGQQSVASGASSVAVGQGSQATNAGSVAIGLNTVSSGVNTVAIGTGAVATNSVAVGAGAQAGGGGAAFGDDAIAINAIKGTALGNGANVSTAGGVALGAGAVADRAGLNGQQEAITGLAVSSTQGAVSVGSAGNERQITNVAGATQATDAVNLRQLQASQAGGVRYDTNADGSTNYSHATLGNGQAPNGTTISNVAPGVAGNDAVNVNQLNDGLANAQQYTDSKFADVKKELGNVSKDASAGTAGAMAMANLPQATIPGKGMLSAGVAGYDGQAALAIGVSKLSDNGRWVVKFSGTANSRGKVGVAAGVGFHW